MIIYCNTASAIFARTPPAIKWNNTFETLLTSLIDNHRKTRPKQTVLHVAQNSWFLYLVA